MPGVNKSQRSALRRGLRPLALEWACGVRVIPTRERSETGGIPTSMPRRQNALRRNRGFTLLELMIVIFIILILASVAMPLYTHHVREAREAVQQQNLQTLNKLIETYKLDKKQSPQALDDLVTAGYLTKLPVDPMTGKADWATDPEDSQDAVDPQNPGIKSAHSSAPDTSTDSSQ